MEEGFELHLFLEEFLDLFLFLFLFFLFLFSAVSSKKMPVLYGENLLPVLELGRQEEHLNWYSKIVVTFCEP